jgi:hypothetical protein
VVETLRKLVLTGFAVFFAQGALLQLIISFGLMLWYTLWLHAKKPYLRMRDNSYAMLSSVMLLLFMFVALLLEVDKSLTQMEGMANKPGFKVELQGYDSDFLAWFLVGLVTTVLTSWFAFLCIDIREFNARQSFRHLDNTLLWLPNPNGDDEEYHVFVSHSQGDAGDQAAHVKKELEKFVSTMVIFTDVAAGRVERQLTMKSKLSSAISRSKVFLVFLTKTYLTRKWCVLELQEAIALKKRIVIIFDTDTRHGGMTSLEELVEYAQGQKARRSADKKQKTSNLFNQDVAGSTVCADLGNWVKSHVSTADGELKIRAFDHKGAAVVATAWVTVGWYRFADWKLVALQLAVEDMLSTLCVGQGGKLKLPVERTQLARARGGQCHLAVSGAHRASKAIAAQLTIFSTKLRIAELKQPPPQKIGVLGALHLADGSTTSKEACPCMLVIVGESLVSDRDYQADVRDAINAGLSVVLVQDCSEQLSITSDALWNRLAEEQGGDVFPFAAKHIRAIFDPISIRCKAELLQAEQTQLSVFDESTLAQIERSVADAQPSRLKLEAKLGAFGKCCAKRGSREAAEPTRRQRVSIMPVDNPIRAAQSSSGARAQVNATVANPMNNRRPNEAGGGGGGAAAQPGLEMYRVKHRQHGPAARVGATV